MTLLDLVVLLIAVFVIFASLANFIRLDAWWIRLFDFPRQQFVIVGIAALTGLIFQLKTLWSWQGLILILLVLSLIHQLRRILPFVLGMPKQVMDCRQQDNDRRVTLLISNVLTPNRNVQALLKHIHLKQPDLVLTLESDDWWQSQLAVLEQDYPYSVKVPLDNLYGMHLYSRLELVDPEIRYLVEQDIPSIHTHVILRSGEQFRLYCLHPTPPAPPENESSTERDAELLLAGREIRQGNEPVIVAGDLNDVAWSRTTRLFQRISGLLDPRRGRGFYSTFHAQHWFLRWPLDHVFHSIDFALFSIERLSSIGSDHFPMHVGLQLSSRLVDVHEEPEPDTDDRYRATEKIQQAV